MEHKQGIIAVLLIVLIMRTSVIMYGHPIIRTYDTKIVIKEEVFPNINYPIDSHEYIMASNIKNRFQGSCSACVNRGLVPADYELKYSFVED